MGDATAHHAPGASRRTSGSDTPGLLVIVSGPSGVGKTTITRRLEEEIGAEFSVSMTTRPKTAKDVEGRDYFFVTPERFQRAIDGDELLEWADVFGNRYGTPRNFVQQRLDRGRVVLLEIDVRGAEQVKAKMPEAVAMFIEPPGEEELLRRLRSRGREDEATIQRRFAKAKDEMARARASGVYDHFLVNDDLEATSRRAVDTVRQRLERKAAP
ncbi:MAG: guanylate kinase [Phycisphaeraceae bacterium]